MAWWSRKNKATEQPAAPGEPGKRLTTEGLFQKCDACRAVLDTGRVIEALRCCPSCGHHFPMPTAERIPLVLDEDSFHEEDAAVAPVDALGFRDTRSYAERLRTTRKATGQADAFLAGLGRIEGRP